MNRKMLIKLIIDFVMLILMLMEMAYKFTGDIVHEVFGISLFILFIIHNILNRRWYQTMLKGNMNMKRILNIIVNLLLLIIMVILILSAVLISRTVFVFMNIHMNEFIARQVHTLAAYWGLVIIAVHLGMHWEMIMARVRNLMKITDKSKICTIIFRIFAVLIIVYGMYASFYRNIGSKLILYYTFDVWNADETFIKLFLDYLSIVGMYVFGTYYAMKIVFKNRNCSGRF